MCRTWKRILASVFCDWHWRVAQRVFKQMSALNLFALLWLYKDRKKQTKLDFIPSLAYIFFLQLGMNIIILFKLDLLHLQILYGSCSSRKSTEAWFYNVILKKDIPTNIYKQAIVVVFQKILFTMSSAPLSVYNLHRDMFWLPTAKLSSNKLFNKLSVEL